MVRERLRRSAAYGVILCGAAYLYYLAAHIEFDEVPGRIGPDAWPKIVLILLLATCVWQIARIVFFGASAATESPDESDVTIVEGTGEFTHLAVLAIIATIVYAYALPWLGFALATALFIAAVTYIGRYRRALPLIATSVVSPLVLIFVFMRVVYIALPLGRGPFKEFSIVLLRLLGVR